MSTAEDRQSSGAADGAMVDVEKVFMYSGTREILRELFVGSDGNGECLFIVSARPLVGHD